MSTRIYVVQDTETDEKALVRAANQAQALRHVVKNRFAVGVASQDELVTLLEGGTTVETASNEQESTS